MPVFLHGLALSNYRGIGPMQHMKHFTDFNFFIGANNAGKSTVLNFIKSHLYSGGNLKLAELEKHFDAGGVPPQMLLCLPKTTVLETMMNAIPSGPQQGFASLLGTICDMLAEEDVVWFYHRGNSQELRFSKSQDVITRRPTLSANLWQSLWGALFPHQTGGDLEHHWIPETVARLAAMHTNLFCLPKVQLIPAIREIGPNNQPFEDYSGRGLIIRLAEIQSPGYDRRKDRNTFDKINAFLSDVTSHPGASIEVPHHREHLLVHMNNRVLPLSSLGTGIQEIIMIAAFCTLSEEQIVCVEEPEIHLHPLLQRKLVRYLRENTSNQYFIATHSPSFIDTPGAGIFHVFLKEGRTTIERALLESELYEVCQDLGARASDIVQSNAVIWVEGPSDRIYVRHWIRELDPKLLEGIHYSIMFYGGRLLSHLSADDKEITEFIGLRALNRNLAIIMDSDRKAEDDYINETKMRLVREFSTGRGLAWVTQGREIESYIDYAELQTAVQHVHRSRYKAPLSPDIYGHALHFERIAAAGESEDSSRPLIEFNVDKVKVAHEVCRHEANLDVLDLRDRITEIVEMIRKANE